MTPKQRLMAHVADLHPGLVERAARANLSQLVRLHSEQHHRYPTSHYHEGVNLGPGDRPPGWRTGEDAILKKPGQLRQAGVRSSQEEDRNDGSRT